MVRDMVCIALRSLLVRRRGAWQIMESVVSLPISFRIVGKILDFLAPQVPHSPRITSAATQLPWSE